MPLSDLAIKMCKFYFPMQRCGCLNLCINSNIAEMMIEKGYATVVRHRRDDEDRSSDYDKLMIAEQA